MNTTLIQFVNLEIAIWPKLNSFLVRRRFSISKSSFKIGKSYLQSSDDEHESIDHDVIGKAYRSIATIWKLRTQSLEFCKTQGHLNHP